MAMNASSLGWSRAYLGLAWPQGTTREQTLERCPNLALASAFFAPGTKEAFSPGWRHQPGLKVDLYSLLEPPTGTKSPPTFSPGW